jgi:hypothetical protein
MTSQEGRWEWLGTGKERRSLQTLRSILVKGKGWSAASDQSMSPNHMKTKALGIHIILQPSGIANAANEAEGV